MRAIEILEKKLLGNFYSRISIGDTFDLYFHGYWLIAHNVSASEEGVLNELLFENFPPANEAVDKEDIAKSTILTATLRKVITNVALNPDSSLECAFENGVRLLFTTDTDIVDWHWAINEQGNDPYTGCIVGCFSPGDIHVGNC